MIASGRTIERVAFDVYRDRVSHEETFMACPHQEQKLQLQPGLFEQEEPDVASH